MKRAIGLLVLALSIFAAIYACVPADTRPLPATLTLTVSPSPAVDRGVVTVDGWSITFDRILVGVGQAGLGHDCTIYGEADYDRILDVTHVPGQRLGILHGLGQCDVDFRIGPPSGDAVLGVNVTDDDKTAMRTRGDDPYVPPSGIGIDVAVTATRAGVTKTLRLQFRPRIRYGNCSLSPDVDAGAAADLQSGQDLTFDLRIEGEAVLRDDVDASVASLRFDPFARADTDGDGIVTLDELRLVPIEDVRDGGAFEAGTYEVDDAGVLQRGRPIVIATLGDYVYELLVPSMPRFRDTGSCLVSLGRRGGPGN